MISPRLSPGAVSLFGWALLVACAGCSEKECSSDDDCEGKRWCSRGGQCMDYGTQAGYPCEKDYHCAIDLWCAEKACRWIPSNLPVRPEPDAGPPPKAPPEPLALPFRPSNVGALLEGRMVGPDSDIVVGMESGCKPCACDTTLQLSVNKEKTGCYQGLQRRGDALEIEVETAKQTGDAMLPGLTVVFLKNLVVGPKQRDPFFVLTEPVSGVVIVAQDKIEVRTSGLFTLAYNRGFPGASPTAVGGGDYGKGPGGGGYGVATGGSLLWGSGEGGAFCALGGLGNNQTTAHGKTYGTPSLVPLWVGSGGGTPNGDSKSGFGGEGGPAFQLVAGDSIVIASGAGFAAPGRDAPSTGSPVSNGGGGGSGGALLLEAPSIEVAGELTALGGKGGGTNKPGGTGGDGRIRFNTMPGGLTVAPGAMIKPAYPGACATLGELVLSAP